MTQRRGENPFLLCRTFPQAIRGVGCWTWTTGAPNIRWLISPTIFVSASEIDVGMKVPFLGSKNCSPKLGPSRKKPQPWSRRIAKSQSESPELCRSAILHLPNHGFFYGFSQVNYSASILVTSVLFFVYGHFFEGPRGGDSRNFTRKSPKIRMRM
jgi:hypothetical protein